MPESTDQASSAEAELRRLSSSLHLDPTVVRRFVDDYLQLIDVRLRRLDQDLDRGDIPAVTVDLLSLATSSSMLGAVEVVQAAEQLRRRTAAGNPSEVADGRRQLIIEVRQAQDRLARIATRCA